MPIWVLRNNDWSVFPCKSLGCMEINKMVRCLCSFDGHDSLLIKYAMVLPVEVIEELLKREWYTTGGERDKGTLFHQHLHILLEVTLLCWHAFVCGYVLWWEKKVLCQYCVVYFSYFICILEGIPVIKNEEINVANMLLEWEADTSHVILKSLST